MTVDPSTAAAYEAGASAYAARDHHVDRTRTDRLRDGAAAGPLLDLGCGTGAHLAALGPDAIGLDPVPAMLAHARRDHPTAPLVRAAAGALPIRPRSLGAAWASKSLQHLTAVDLPLALADLHRSLALGAPVDITAFTPAKGRDLSPSVLQQVSQGDIPGRRFTFWSPAALADLLVGAGFEDVIVDSPTGPEDDPRATTTATPGANQRHRPDSPTQSWAYLRATATRGRTLADTVGPEMDLLVCGLNPSLHAADAGVGYAGPGNRFWPALATAGLLPPGADRDPWRLLRDGGIGMTDLVKRATPRAAELTPEEYRAGLARLERLCALLAPRAVVLVGLAGWRAAADRRAAPGWQDRHLGPSPIYLMGSTSGLNAATPLEDLVAHLRAAAAGPAGEPPRQA